MNMARIGDADPFTAAIPATKVELTVSFCVLYTQGIANREWREFGRTEVIDNTLNPDFVRKFILDYFFEERQNLLGSLGSRLEKPLIKQLTYSYFFLLLIVCVFFIYSHDFIGEFSTSYREMCRSQSQFHVYEVLFFTHKNRHVTLLSCLVDTELSFLDYIRGNPSQPTSLHYMSPYQLNDYAMALRAIGEIIQDYDSDKMFPALGFGAKLPPDGRVSHEFPLNGNPQNPYCKGIDGVMEAYYQSLKSVRLYGPTHFSPVINHVARYASAVTDGSQYFILLIISDGVITDMAQTKESIVNAASLPMSIIIVGVGPAEFDEMIELDGDEERISSQGRYAERDIVQFVPFRDYIDRRGNHILSMARLAKEVLAEIPDQFLSYMRTRGIKPGPQPPPYTPCPPPAIHPLHTRRVSRI
uniref:Copine VIII n=1 Tax=Fundulus heteroclitus TaxID=8078 RepID=A0A3Q2PWT1_FUNHE